MPIKLLTPANGFNMYLQPENNVNLLPTPPYNYPFSYTFLIIDTYKIAHIGTQPIVSASHDSFQLACNDTIRQHTRTKITVSDSIYQSCIAGITTQAHKLVSAIQTRTATSSFVQCVRIRVEGKNLLLHRSTLPPRLLLTAAQLQLSILDMRVITYSLHKS